MFEGACSEGQPSCKHFVGASHVPASLLSAKGWQVAHLGEMDATGRLGLRQQAAGPAALAQRRLFGDVEPQWMEVDLKRIAVERKRAFGVPGWVCSCAGGWGSWTLSANCLTLYRSFADRSGRQSL